MPSLPAVQSNPQPTPAAVLPVFQRHLPGSIITDLVTASGRRFYHRLFIPLVVVWGFIFQRLHPDHTCEAAVSYFASGGADELCPDLSARMSDNTAAYCQARARLPLSVLTGALRHTAQSLHDDLGQAGLWHGRPVGLLDGSTLRLPATDELIEHYGRPTNQHGACHWPLMRLVAGFDLFSGAAQAVAEGPYGQSEQDLAVSVITTSPAEMIWVGDRNFGVYRLVQVAYFHGADVVWRLKVHQARALAAQTLRPGDDLDVAWHPSAATSRQPGRPVQPIPGRLLYVWLERPGFRPVDLYLFTTLTDRDAYPLVELVWRYGRRWEVELDLRHIKTTLEMETLSGQSVEMVRKELVAGLLAYNLVRGVMAQAAHATGLTPLALSFARCWRRLLDTLRTLSVDASPTRRQATWQRLLERLARCRLPKRKKLRIEPRAVWGRPQPYPRLKGTRAQARQAVLEQMATQEC
jgi:hypothetical protein